MPRRARKSLMLRQRTPVVDGPASPSASMLFQAADLGHHHLFTNRFIDLCASEASIRHLWPELNKRRMVGRAVNPSRYCLYLTEAWLGPENVEVAEESRFSLDAFDVCIWPLLVSKLHVGYVLKLPEPGNKILASVSLWPVYKIEPFLIRIRRVLDTPRLKLDSFGTGIAYQDDSFSIITSTKNGSVVIVAGSLPMTIKGVTSWRGSQSQDEEPA